jgi:hypothetical protein
VSKRKDSRYRSSRSSDWLEMKNRPARGGEAGGGRGLGPMTILPGAQFKILVDGTPRSYRDRKDIAIG